ncbi:GNAT family N-acetyltransferase [uncultured Streptomyces sp.]|uniref:GNAT family N-acetyltransferase n=1 Tax=uncultured Streptomyces sp. TaxID=174707 RepID=UPI002618D8FD|nr:GNAT family N-acetyltransferase [uncultured Streptomyces sp.]
MSRIPRDPQVRPGTEADLQALTDIYNHYVGETAITFDTEPFTLTERLPWLLAHDTSGPHRLLIAEECAGDGAARLLGYATSGPFRPKAAYGTSVELSVYCAPDATDRGVGRLLYTALFDALAGQDVHRAYAGIAQPNAASVRLHEPFGFRHVGTYHEVGRKFGRFWDVAWYEKPLPAGP